VVRTALIRQAFPPRQFPGKSNCAESVKSLFPCPRLWQTQFRGPDTFSQHVTSILSNPTCKRRECRRRGCTTYVTDSDFTETSNRTIVVHGCRLCPSPWAPVQSAHTLREQSASLREQSASLRLRQRPCSCSLGLSLCDSDCTNHERQGSRGVALGCRTATRSMASGSWRSQKRASSSRSAPSCPVRPASPGAAPARARRCGGACAARAASPPRAGAKGGARGGGVAGGRRC
jgi:hypothetical protein